MKKENIRTECLENVAAALLNFYGLNEENYTLKQWEKLIKEQINSEDFNEQLNNKIFLQFVREEISNWMNKDFK